MRPRPTRAGRCCPEGRLREPLSSLERADLVVVTKCEQADPATARGLAARWAPGAPVYHATTRVLGIRDDSGEEVRAEDLPGETLVAVAALAHPSAFLGTLATLGIAPAGVETFRDHDPYAPFALGRIERRAEESGATAVITTEKDAVKLEGRLRLPLYPRRRRDGGHGARLRRGRARASRAPALLRSDAEEAYRLPESTRGARRRRRGCRISRK